MARPLSVLRAALAAVVGCSLLALTAAQPFSLNIATGYNTTTYSGDSVLVSGQTDANWVVNAVLTTGVRRAFIVAETDPDFPVGAWLANGPNSSWISLNAFTATPPAGTSIYMLSLALPPQADLSSLTLSGALACDNNCTLLLNGHFVASYVRDSPPSNDDLSLVGFTAPSSFFHAGHNLFRLFDYGDGTTDGVRVQGFVTGSVATGGVVGDPQFVGLRGQSFQVHGLDGAVYNIVSENNTQVNARFVFLESGRCPTVAALPEAWTNCWSHPGSYMGEMSFQQVVDGTLHAALIVAGGADQGFSTVQMDGKELKVGDLVRFVQPNSAATSKYFSLHYTSTHTVTVQMEHFESKLTSSDMFINQALRPTVPISQLRSHGLLGQTHCTQTYQSAIKFIEGDVDDYVIDSQDIFGTDFHYNQFLE